MGINLRIREASKPKDVIIAQVKLEKDLKSCMRCRFFYGNNRQCIASKCVKEDAKPGIREQDKKSECFECPYRQSEQYCFPCMKKMLGKGKNEQIRERDNEAVRST